MEIWGWFVLGIWVGVMIGAVIHAFLSCRKPVGTIKVDIADPEDPPYFFLEMEKSGYDDVMKGNDVLLKVDLTARKEEAE